MMNQMSVCLEMPKCLDERKRMKMSPNSLVTNLVVMEL